MEVRHGYKQTEVGVIPVDWDVKPLSAVLSKGRLGGNYPNQDQESAFPLMKMGNISRGGFDMSKVEYIVPGVTPQIQHRLTYGDVLFNTRNTLELVGKIAIWRDELPVAYYNSNLMRFEFDVNQVCSNEYANYALNSSGTVTRLRQIATGTTSVAAIYTRDLMEQPVIVPPKPEQRAIATALGDVDALLGELAQLIAKKRDLKQAAMQQLLTGQTRLPGFRGEWEVRPFDSVLSRSNAKAHQIQTSDYQVIGTYPVVDQGKEAIVGFSDREDKRFRCPDGGVIVFGDHTCFVKFVDFDFVVGADGTQILHGKVGQSTRFHAFQLQYRGVEPTGYNRHFKILKERDFVVPPFSEQTAIVSTLYEMESELTALEARRDKTRALKQAMMQELLTGKTRLVPFGGAHA